MPIGLYTILLLCALLFLLPNTATATQIPSTAPIPTASQPPSTLSSTLLKPTTIPNTNQNCTHTANTTERHCGPALGYDSLKKGGGRVGGWGRSPGVYVGGATSGTVGQGPTSVVAFLGFCGLILVGGVVMG